MVKVKWSRGASGSSQGLYSRKVNGITTLGEACRSGSVAGFDGVTYPDEPYCISKIEETSGCNGGNWPHNHYIEFYEDDGVTLIKRVDSGLLPAYNAQGAYVSIIKLGSPKGGKTKDSTPTYLETLDKLDQWSSAQYVPEHVNSRNELNL